MNSLSEISKLETLVTEDKRFFFTQVCYVLVLIIYINGNFLLSSFLGLIISIPYLLINSMFLGHVFFKSERTLIRLMFGILLLIVLLGFVGWFAVIIYNLNATNVTLVLLIVATVCSVLNRKVRFQNEH